MLIVSQKDNFLATKINNIKYRNLADNLKYLSWKKSTSYKKTQKGNAAFSGIKLMNRRSSLEQGKKF